jgi:hypothetical protein
MEAIAPEAETDGIDPAKKRLERRLAILEELAEIGLKLARTNGEKALAKRAAEAEAETAAVKPPPAETSNERNAELAFTRMARLVQQNLALRIWPCRRGSKRGRGNARPHGPGEPIPRAGRDRAAG